MRRRVSDINLLKNTCAQKEREEERERAISDHPRRGLLC